MKAILIAIQRKWVELILRGLKTEEVRKRIPHINGPFKVYIYVTSGKFDITLCDDLSAVSVILTNKARGKVIGEFICDKTILYGECGFEAVARGGSCLTESEARAYGKEDYLYGLHISDLKIYDKPKELGEFKTPPCEKDEEACVKCKHKVNIGTYYDPEWNCDRDNGKQLTRPPQSWCYIESL